VKTTHVFALTPMLLLAIAGVVQAQKPAAVAEVQVAPAAITIQAGNTQKLIAVAYDDAGNVITTAHYRWSSNNLNVAQVDSTGTVTAVADGSAVIRAEALGSGPPLKHGAAVINVRRRAP
jgi:large repetitive protein